MQMPPLLSVIVPAYNEAARLDKTLSTIFGYLEQHYRDSELIVVDDGSSDDTLRVIEQHLARSNHIKTNVISVRPNRGKGHAVHVGLLAATAPIALFTDADLSTPMTETLKLVEPIEKGQYDVTFGSRALDRSLIGVHQPWRREQGGRVFNFLVRLATSLPYWDTQCGFKAFRLSVCRPIIEAATIERFGFDVELLYISHHAGLRLLEVPVRWDHNDGSKVSVLRDSLRMFNEVRTIRAQSRRGVYDGAIKASRSQASREREESGDGDDNAAPVDVEMTTDLANADTMKTMMSDK
jgi:dolichyl-phosphate beta-glucosyltransferase